MSNEDVGNVLSVISDLSTFASFPTGCNRAFVLPAPRPTDEGSTRLRRGPAFQAGAPAAASFMPNEVYFNGNSQGGILGGAATAISKEWTRAGSACRHGLRTLLPRSVDFDPFLPLSTASIPTDLHSLEPTP